MAQGVSSEAVFACDEMATFYWRSDEDRLTEIGVGIEESNEAFDFDVVELAGEMRDRVVPANQAVSDHVEPGSYLFGDHVAGDFVLNVEEIGVGAFSAVERGNRSAEELQFRGIADARVAARAGKVEARNSTHLVPGSCWANFSTRAAGESEKHGRIEGLRENFKESASGAKALLRLRTLRRGGRPALPRRSVVTQARRAAKQASKLRRSFGSKFAIRARCRSLFSTGCRTSNPKSSRLESAEQIPLVVCRGALARNADARRIVSSRLDMCGSLSSVTELVLNELRSF